MYFPHYHMQALYKIHITIVTNKHKKSRIAQMSFFFVEPAFHIIKYMYYSEYINEFSNVKFHAYEPSHLRKNFKFETWCPFKCPVS